MGDNLQFNETPGQDFSHFQTQALHAGFEPTDFHGAPMVLPLTMATTYKQKEPGVLNGEYEYGRSGNPTREGWERSMAALEGGKYGIALASGLAACDVILHDMNSGDHIVAMDDLYGGTQRLMRVLLKKHNLDTTMVDMTDLELLKKAIRPNTKVVWIETPTNPTMKVVDIKAAVEVVKAVNKDIVTVVDNTFASPYFQRPLHLGADVVTHSISKYINGHSDVIMGSLITNSKELCDRYKFVQNAAGMVPGPFDCYMAWRGAKTLALRMRHHMSNGLALARFLEGHPMVEKVLHPGLPSHPQHELAKRQMRGYSGTFSFYLKGGLAPSRVFLSSLRVLTCAESLGGYESLIEHPAIMTHASVPAEHRATLGISDGFIRVSVGLEDIEDLLDDVKQALEKASKA